MIDSQLIPLNRRSLEGSFSILRGIPTRIRRQIGPWCFFDMLKTPISEELYLNVAPHPHIGLQILSWMIEGESIHQDSLGNQLTATKDTVNLMTAGRGIVHTEDSPQSEITRKDAFLHLLQLWIALPQTAEDIPPDFMSLNQEALPKFMLPNGALTLILGEHAQLKSPLKTYSPIVALELTLNAGIHTIPLEASFEYGAYLIAGDAILSPSYNSNHPNSLVESNGSEGEPSTLTEHSLLAFTGADQLTIHVKTQCRLFLFGGEPLPESHYIWWNYVSSSPEKIREKHGAWEAEDHQSFPKIPQETRSDLIAPEIPARFIAF